MPRLKYSAYTRDGLAVVSGVLLLVAAKYLFHYLEVVFFSFPLSVVALLTLFLGARAGGILSIVVGAGIWFFFLEPRDIAKIPGMTDVAQLVGFFIASGIIVYLINTLEHTRSRLQSAYNEKEVLLKELYHRTKNNLQVVSSLISLQCSRRDESESIHSMCADIQGRIRAMALVHEKLYKSEDLAHVNMRDYIEDLSKSILSGYPVLKENLELVRAVEDILLPIELVVPCGLIINEFMSNSMKYAFPEGRGRINIAMHASEGTVELVYMDDGPGLPPDFDLNKAESLGLKLVNTLAVKQLNGSIDHIRNKGGKFVIKFPAPP